VNRSTASRSDRPLQALEDHDHRHDERRDRAPPDVGEEVREQRVGEEREALPVEEGMDRALGDTQAIVNVMVIVELPPALAGRSASGSVSAQPDRQGGAVRCGKSLDETLGVGRIGATVPAIWLV
jgi:hypothetical protein